VEPNTSPNIKEYRNKGREDTFVSLVIWIGRSSRNIKEYPKINDNLGSSILHYGCVHEEIIEIK